MIRSYKMKITGEQKALEDTIKIYREVVNYFIPLVNQHWDEYSKLSGKERFNQIEKLFHTTKYNKAKYPDFNKRYHKFPSYLRRGALADAIGAVSSYRSNLANWKENPKGREPKLGKFYYKTPAFYRNNMFKDFNVDENTCSLKVYKNKDWVFETYTLKTSDVTYYLRHLQGSKQSAPTLKRRGKHMFLEFAYTDTVDLVDEVTKICAVDLGIGTDATCSIMGQDGTIYARQFFKFSAEHDRLDTLLNRIKRNQRRGSKENKTLWRGVVEMCDDIADKTVHAILRFGMEHRVEAFVLEFLDFKGKNKVKRAHFWRYKRMYKVLSMRAHREGLRVARVNARNTSKLAFDGSGQAKRGREITDATPYALLQFSTGKFYNADLNASYNIGARYFIRELLKPLSVKKELALQAKVPAIAKKSTCTLSDLISLGSELVGLQP